MPRAEENAARSRPVLLLGAGRRPRELGAVIAALGTVRAEADGESTIEPHRPQGLDDLEGLLALRPSAGTLILDYEHVPAEDIGFVRRFLERHAEWRLVVVGEDASDRRARGLLSLPRTQWLAWPPDLDQIGSLLPSARPPESAERRSSARFETLRAPREGTSASARSEPSLLDVGALLEEILASAALAAEGGPRTLYRCDQTLILRRERSAIAPGLSDLLALARRCAGAEGVVSAQVDPARLASDPPDTVRIRLEFPCGELSEEDRQGLLDRPFAGSPSLAAEVELARRGAAMLREQGCRVALLARRPDRLRLEIYAASEPLPRSVETPTARAGKAEDPFA